MDQAAPPPAGTPSPIAPPASAPPAAGTEDKTVAIVSYITIFGFIAAIVINSNKKTQLGAFHLRQMLGLILTGLLMVIPLLNILIGICLLVLWIMGLMSAINGQMKPVPLLGGMYQKWFGNAFN